MNRSTVLHRTLQVDKVCPLYMGLLGYTSNMTGESLVHNFLLYFKKVH